jgi:hypothetical protein
LRQLRVSEWALTPPAFHDALAIGIEERGPMSVQPADRNRYVSLRGKRLKPYTFVALTKGAITADTNVCRLGWVSWHPAAPFRD